VKLARAGPDGLDDVARLEERAAPVLRSCIFCHCNDVSRNRSAAFNVANVAIKYVPPLLRLSHEEAVFLTPII
jgi:hypothetical protein